MSAYWIKFFSIYLASLFKFIAGPALGSAAGFGLLEILLVTVGGMMTSVFVFVFLGEWIKAHWKIKVKARKKNFTPKTRRLVRIWSRYGAFGVAFITPIILTPIGGTLVMLSFGVKKRKIFAYMGICAVLWALVFGLSIDFLLTLPFLERLSP